MKLHPGWEFKLWRENEIIELIRKNVPEFLDVFTSYDAPIKKHDAARFVILKCFGGVYIDHDIIPLRNIEPLLKSFDLVISNEQYHCFSPVTAFLASVKGLKIWDDYIKKINSRVMAKKQVFYATGPRVLTEVCKNYVQKHGTNGLSVYHKDLFSPKHWDDAATAKNNSIAQLMNLYPRCFILQIYDGTWH